MDNRLLAALYQKVAEFEAELARLSQLLLSNLDAVKKDVANCKVLTKNLEKKVAELDADVDRVRLPRYETPPPREQTLIDLLKNAEPEGLRFLQIRRLSDLHATTVSRILRRLRKNGLVTKEDYHYRLLDGHNL